MDANNRKLLTGLAGIALLLIGILVFAQLNAHRNSYNEAYPQQPE